MDYSSLIEILSLKSKIFLIRKSHLEGVVVVRVVVVVVEVVVDVVVGFVVVVVGISISSGGGVFGGH